MHERDKNNDNFKILFEQAPLGYQSLDIDGNFLEVNQKWLDTFGYERNEVIGKWFGDFLTPEYKEAFKNNFQIFKERGHIHSEFEMVRKNGDILFIAFEGQIGNDAEGHFKQTHCILEDITEKRHNEESILLHAQITENSPIITAYHDKDLNMIWANRAYLKATGLTLDQIKGRKCYDVWNLPKPCNGCPVITAIETGENAYRELTPANQDHWPETQGYWLSQATPMLDKQGAIIGAVEFAIDITERKKAENDLKKLLARHKTFIDTVPDIIMEVDRNKVYTWGNKAGYEFFGDDVIGKEASYYFEGDQDLYEKVEPLFKGNEDVIYLESYQRRKDGKIRLLAWWCKVYKDTDGNAIGAISSARDITDIAQTEIDLKKKNRELEETNSVMVGRELRMIELKKEVNKLLKELGKDEKYEC
jgi:PAS domain S-box-containing protein